MKVLMNDERVIVTKLKIFPFADDWRGIPVHEYFKTLDCLKH